MVWVRFFLGFFSFLWSQRQEKHFINAHIYFHQQDAIFNWVLA